MVQFHHRRSSTRNSKNLRSPQTNKKWVEACQLIVTVAAVLPTPRGRGRGRVSATRPVPTYPPGYSSEMSNFNIAGADIREIQPASLGIENNFHWNRPITANPSVPLIGVPPQTNVIPLMIQNPPNAPNFVANHGGFQAQQQNHMDLQCKLPTAQASCSSRLERGKRIVYHPQ